MQRLIFQGNLDEFNFFGRRTWGFVQQLFGKKISGLFTIPSGIVATEVSTLEKIAKEIPEIGILTTKSIGPEPRAGNKEPIVGQPSPFAIINAVGLTNPGADEFASRLSRIKIPEDKFLLISIFGKDEKEFYAVAKKLTLYADGFELNISCPHAEGCGLAVGQDIALVERIVRAVVSLGKPTVIKLAPSVDIEKTIKQAVKAGIKGVTAINTKGPVPYLHDGQPVLSNQVGGLSGQPILPLGLASVKRVRAVTDLPIIACGGIRTAKEVEQYRAAGANYFGIGSALAGMSFAEIKDYFRSLSTDFKNQTNYAEGFLKTETRMKYSGYRVANVDKFNDNVFILKLNKKIQAKPGQFVFLWLPGKGEKPFSVFDDEPLTLFIQNRGCFSSELAKLKVGDKIYVRGPYGNSPPTEGKILLVGGGTGVAAMYLFAKKYPQTVALLGAKDKSHLLYKKFQPVCLQVHLHTESGDIGHKGLVTDDLEKILQEFKPDYCFNCGPAVMVKRVIEQESRYVNPENIYSSLEMLTKCGTGLCGSCANSKGYRNCVDGSFLKPKQI